MRHLFSFDNYGYLPLITHLMLKEILMSN